ncbi:unnamed protein product [Closterium sp. Yama58-4]|nr:unnamed protein product [Closterium sp. Yama58-4]
MTHLRTSNLRYRAALKPEFLAKKPPPMYNALYFLVSYLPVSLHPIQDHFLSLDPSELTLASFESLLLEAKTSAYAVAASRGTPRTSFFEGCAPSLLAPSVAPAATVDFLGAEVAGAASALSGRRNKGGRQKGKGCGGGGGDGGGRGGGGGGSKGGGGGGGRGGGGGGGGGGGAGAVAALWVAEAAWVAVVVEPAGVEVRELRLDTRLVGAEVLGVDSSSSRVGRRPSRRSSYVSGWSNEVVPEEEAAVPTSDARDPTQETWQARPCRCSLLLPPRGCFFARSLVRRPRCVTG